MEEKFQNPTTTAKGEDRASVQLRGLETLWFNTGTLCNLACENCYIESSPTNDRLVFIEGKDIRPFLAEIKEKNLGTKMIAYTGGEPFINPSIIELLRLPLDEGFEVLVLTNATRVLERHYSSLKELRDRFGDRLHIRVSLDHYTEEEHDKERGAGNFHKTLKQLQWLHEHNFNISIASRSLLGESQEASIKGHKNLLENYGVSLDLSEKLVIFPEMKSGRDLPEITTQCWDILGVRPEDQMCASERMVVKRKGKERAVVMPCTLLAYDEQFILGDSLEGAQKRVFLNHPFCAEFCVLGGASCSTTK